MYFEKLYSTFGLMGVLPIIAAVTISPTISTNSNLNNAATTSDPAVTSVCCFVVQDTVTEEWWQQYSTDTFSGVVNLTSITTLITQYLTTTVMNYETNVYITNTTSLHNGTVGVGGNPLLLLNIFVQGPTQTTSILYPQNGTQIVTAGVIVASPAAFNIYTTVKIITVPAVTDSLGSIVCATRSEFFTSFIMTPDVELTTSILGPFFYSGINSNAEAYFGAVSLSGEPTTSIDKPTGTIISLTTPFIYTPTRGASGAASTFIYSAYCSPTDGVGISENYNAYYRSQYLGLESCLPGGPTIVPLDYCLTVSDLPTAVNALEGGLTSQTVMIVTPPTQQPAAQVTPTPVAVVPTPSPTSAGNEPQQIPTPVIIPQVQPTNTETLPLLGLTTILGARSCLEVMMPSIFPNPKH